MGYIKKLKNNELVGGTDKTTVYPVTSTEAVFEEVSENNFQSQKSINVDRLERIETLEAHDENHEGRVSTLEEHDSNHESRVQELEDTMPDTVKSITINGSTKTYTVDDEGNVDLTIYTVDSDPEMPDIADNVRDLRNMVGTSTPILETSHKTRIENLETTVGTGGTVDQRISDAVTIEKNRAEGIEGGLQTQINGKQKTLSVGAGITLTSEGVISATADPSVAKVVEALPTGDAIVDGLIYLVKTSTAGTYSQHVHSTSGWSSNLPNVSLGITADDAIDSTSTNPIQNDAITAQIGYFVCGDSNGSSETKNVDAPSYSPSDVGGAFKIKMNYANTSTDTVYLRFNSDNTTKKELRYNREPVTLDNSWEEGEVISVYYDGTYYQASNAQGGGGKAEKIKYDNSKSILPTENVQDTLDGITEELVFEDVSDRSLGTTRNWIVNGSGNYIATSGYQCFMSRVYPGEKYVIKASDENAAYYAFLASNPSRVTSNTEADFVTGYEERYTIKIGEIGAFTVPDVEGTIYLYIQKQSSSVFTPEYVHKLTTVKEKVDNDIYRKGSVGYTALTDLTMSYPDCVIIEGSSSSYTILYNEVSAGDKFHITASNDTNRRFVIGFTTEMPAVNVQVFDAIDLRTISVDEYVESPINGYLVIYKYASYFTDLNVSKINGELADIAVENRVVLGGVEKKVNGYTPYLETATAVKQLLNYTSLKWSSIHTDAATKYTTRIEPISQYCGKVLVIINTNVAANVALLSDNDNTQDDFGHFSRPWEKFIRLAANQSAKILLTENDKYLYYQVTNSSGDAMFPIFRIEESDKETFDTVENYSLTLDRTDYNLDEKDEETNPDGIDILQLGIASSTNAWSFTSSNVKGFFLDVSTHKGGYLFVSNYNEGCYLAFLRDNNNCDVQGAIPNYAIGSGRTSVGTGFRMKYSIPTDANLVFLSYQDSSETATYPAGVFAIGKDIGGSTEVARTLDIGQINLQKKASQYLNVKWTAKANIATKGTRGHTSTYITAGDYSGMLYSSCQEYDRSVGHDVSMRTFMTAVNNPYSLLYTEDPHTGSTDADYDMDYHAQYGSTTFSFFGMVCSRFACYASGMEEWATEYYEWLWKQGYLTKIQDQSAQGVEIGDYIWLPGHVLIITNYVKSGGVVESVTTTEAVTPVVRLRTRTASEFNNWLNAVPGGGNGNGPGCIYRNNEIYKNVVYEASPFVAIDDEVPQEYQYNNDICTYAGDYAAFRLKGENDTRNDYKVWLNYNLGDTPSRQWTGIKLYKETYNDSNVLSLVLVATYNDVDFTKHKYLIPPTDLTEVGKYRACLFDATTESEPTYFEIIGAKVSYTRDGDVITVNFGYDENNAPTKVVVETLGGRHRADRILSQSERDSGTVTFNPKVMNAKQAGEALDYNDAYIKAFFQGEYGRVTNEPLKIDYNS